MEDKFNECHENISKKFDIQPLAKGKQNKPNLLQRKIAEYKFRRKINKISSPGFYYPLDIPPPPKNEE